MILDLPRLHEAQREVREAAARYNVVVCGRRWGKTRMGCLICIESAINKNPVAWFAPSYKLLDQAWDEMIEMAEPIIARVNKQERQIEFKTGGTIDFWTLRQTNSGQSVAGRGRFYADAIIDEAALAPCLEQDWTQAIRPTLTDLRGNAWFLSTPHGQNFFWTLYNRGMDGEQGYKSWRMPTISNPYIHPDEVEEAERTLPADAFAQEYLAEFLSDAANPFGVDAIKACVVPDIHMTSDPVVWGIDLAKSHDWTVAVGLDENGRVCAFQRWQSDWRNTIARISAMIRSTPALVDATGVGDPIVEQLQATCPNVEGFKFSMGSKQVIMEGLAVAIQQQKITLPEHTPPYPGVLIRELEAFRYEYRPTGVRYSAPEGCHDDTVCALALAVHCQVKSAPPATLNVFSAWDDAYLEDEDFDDDDEVMEMHRWFDGPTWDGFYNG